MVSNKELTPKEIVEELDKYIIGQNDAKRSVAIALRNRYRRLQLDDEMKKEITPKNILMIGPTGVGKTEIARRLANVVNAPFVKIEATKFTEVGYVGRDVESMIRDLTETALKMVKEDQQEDKAPEIRRRAIDRVLQVLAPGEIPDKYNPSKSPLGSMFNIGSVDEESIRDQANFEEEVTSEVQDKRDELRPKVTSGQMDNEQITIRVEKKSGNNNQLLDDRFSQMGMDLSGALGSLIPNQKVSREVTVKEAIKIFEEEEKDNIVQVEDVSQTAIDLVENSGIVFIDEIDKIIGGENQNSSGEVSREGVQRDILPIVEGSAVQTKYGTVNTDHILFIGSGAFSFTKPSDMIPELQGRFPIRVELDDLDEEDFYRILTEPDNSLIHQYQAMLATENINVTFTKESLEKMSEIAYKVNEDTDNIGARRLHTIIEKLLEDLLFESPNMPGGEVNITEAYVEDKIGHIAEDSDLSRYIL